MLFGVAPDDPLTFVGVALLLGVVSLLAAYLPARRAMVRIDAPSVRSGRFGMPSLFWPDAHCGSHPSSRSHWQNPGLPWPAFPRSANLSCGRGSRLEVLIGH
jgi:hypothetical protein